MAEPRVRRSVSALVDYSHLPDYLFQEKNGTWYGEIGQYRMRSAFMPVYRRSSSSELVLDGFRGVERIMSSGHEFRLCDLLADVAPDDRLVIERICRTIHYRNFAVSGGGEYRIFLAITHMTRRDLAGSTHDFHNVPKRLARFGLTMEQTVAEFSENSEMEADVLSELAESLRAMGAGIALMDFGSRQSSSELLEDLEPDIVGIDPALLKKAAEKVEAAELLRSLVDVAARLGVSVLVDGIEISKQLDVAMSTNATLFRGDLLGRADPRLFRARVSVATAPPRDAVA